MLPLGSFKEGTLIRHMTSTLVVWMLLPTMAGAAADRRESKPTIKEQVLEIPAGSVVEVRTLDKEKIRGRIGQTTDHGFAIQRIRSEKVEEVNVEFQNTKSIKMVASQRPSAGANAGKTVALVLVGVLAGVGIVFLIAISTW